MRQELQLSQRNHGGKLQHNLLGVSAELLGLPAARVDARVQQLSDWVLGIFARAVDHTVLKLDLVVLELGLGHPALGSINCVLGHLKI